MGSGGHASSIIRIYSCVNEIIRITGDSLLTAEYQTPDTPPAIDSTVLISATVLSGFETGTGPLNPYGQFQKLKPSAVIDYGVFVYDGHFEIPLAAALRPVQKARGLS